MPALHWACKARTWVQAPPNHSNQPVIPPKLYQSHPFLAQYGLKRESTLEEQHERTLVLRLSALHGVSEENILSAKKVWKDVAHAMLNLKELIYLF